MFQKRRLGLGKLRSDEGFTLSYSHRSVNYADGRGTFQFGFEDGFLFPRAFQSSGVPIKLTAHETEQIIKRVLEGLRFDGHNVELFTG